MPKILYSVGGTGLAEESGVLSAARNLILNKGKVVLASPSDILGKVTPQVLGIRSPQ